VVRIINQTIMTRNVNYVLEADIKGFFDNVNHDWLMKFLGNDMILLQQLASDSI
jgi:hypothetical protein